MSRQQYDNFMIVRDLFKKEVANIHDLIQIIIPQSEEDRKQFKLFLSMITQLNNRMQSATNLMDVADILNLDELENDWEELKEHIDYYTFCRNEGIDGVISTTLGLEEEDEKIEYD